MGIETVMAFVTDSPRVPIKSNFNGESRCPRIAWWKLRKRHAWKITAGPIQGEDGLFWRVWRFECTHCGQWIERPSHVAFGKNSGCLHYAPCVKGMHYFD